MNFQSPPCLWSALMLPTLLCASVSADEWPVVASSYSQLEWIAGLSGESPDNGNEWNGAEGQPAVQAELSEPHSAMADLYGNVYVADKNAHAIRRIAPDGTLTTVAGNNLAGFSGDGVATVQRLNGPQHAYPLPDGTFYILDSGNKKVRKVDRAGNMTTVLTDSAELSRGLWVRRDGGMIYYCTEKVLKRWMPILGDSAGVVVATGFTDTGNIDVARNGDIYVSDRGASRIYRVPAGNSAGTPPVAVAGTGGTTGHGPGSSGNAALTVGMREARGVAFHPQGGYFVATHHSGDIWYVDTLGKAWMFIEGDNNKVHSTTPVTVPTSAKAISEPRSISVALNGDLLMATNDAGYIKRVRYTGPLPAGPPDKVLTGNPAAGFTLRWTPEPEAWSWVESTADPAGPWTVQHSAGPSVTALEWSSSPLPDAPRYWFRIRSFRSWPN